jgi:hypothetical protein
MNGGQVPSLGHDVTTKLPIVNSLHLVKLEASSRRPVDVEVSEDSIFVFTN